MNKEDYKKSWESAIYKIADLQEENEKLRKTIKDDDLTINKLCKENKILRENAEHNDEVVDKYWWENKNLQQRIDKAIEKLQLLIDIGFDYDGFNQVSSLKSLIDELVSYAKDSRDILKGDNNE